MDTKSYFMSSLLMKSVLQNDLETTEELLKRGADPNLVLREGATPFHIAAGNTEKSEAFTQLLLKYGGDPNVMSVEGVTPLHVACVYDHCDATRLLLMRKADPLLQDNEGQNAFAYAENSGCKICRHHLYHYSGLPMPIAPPDGEKKVPLKRRSQRSFYTSQIQSVLNNYDPEKHIIDVTSPDHPQLLERTCGDETHLIQSLLNEYDPKKHIIDVTSPDHPQLLERLSGDKIVRLDAGGSHPSSPCNGGHSPANQNDVTTDSGLDSDVHSPCEVEGSPTFDLDPEVEVIARSCKESPTGSESYHSCESRSPQELEAGMLESVPEVSIASAADSAGEATLDSEADSMVPEPVSIDTPPGDDFSQVDTLAQNSSGKPLDYCEGTNNTDTQVETNSAFGFSCDSLESDTFLRTLNRLHHEVGRMQRGSFSSLESSLADTKPFPSVGFALDHSNEARKRKGVSQQQSGGTDTTPVPCEMTDDHKDNRNRSHGLAVDNDVIIIEDDPHPESSPATDTDVVNVDDKCVQCSEDSLRVMTPEEDSLHVIVPPEFKAESSDSTGYTTLLAELTLEDSVLHDPQDTASQRLPSNHAGMCQNRDGSGTFRHVYRDHEDERGLKLEKQEVYRNEKENSLHPSQCKNKQQPIRGECGVQLHHGTQYTGTREVCTRVPDHHVVYTEPSHTPTSHKNLHYNGQSPLNSADDRRPLTTWREVRERSREASPCTPRRDNTGWTSPCGTPPRAPPINNLQKKLESLQSHIFPGHPEMTLDESDFESHRPAPRRYAVRSSEKIPNKPAPMSPFKDSGICSFGRFSPRKNQTSANNPLCIVSPTNNITEDVSSDHSRVSEVSGVQFYPGYGPKTSSRNNTMTGNSLPIPHLTTKEISLIRRFNTARDTSSLAGSQCSCSSVRTVEHVVSDAEGSFKLVENHYPVDDATSPCAHADPACAHGDGASSMDSTILYWDDLAASLAAPGNALVSHPTIPSDIQELSNPALRAQLEALGDLPGPITHTTRKLYEKRLLQLRSDPAAAAANQKKAQQGYPTELSNALKGQLDISALQDLEDSMCRPFHNPDPNRNWREGVSKTSMNYLLLDPRITRNLPNRVKTIGTEEGFCTFIKAIFYVGKGKRSRPYAHFKEAMHQLNNPHKQASQKVSHILSIWDEDLGVVSLHLFQSVIPVEAYTREAAMIEALGIHRLTNVKSGDFYGPTVTWNSKQRRLLGVRLLQKAFRIFLSEGERQIKPGDILKQ